MSLSTYTHIYIYIHTHNIHIAFPTQLCIDMRTPPPSSADELTLT